MTLRLLLFLCLSLVCCGCRIFRPQPIPSKLTHKYIIKVISPLTQKPVFGATIKCYPDGNEGAATLLRTKENGQVEYEVSGPPTIAGRSVYFKSNIECMANTGNYYFEEQTIDLPPRFIYWEWGDSPVSSLEAIVKMNDIESVLCKGIYDDYPQNDIGPLAKFLSLVSLPNNLILNQLCSDSFKGHRYLKISLNSELAYNANKLFDYDVAKVLFIMPVLEYARAAFQILNVERQSFGLEVSIDTSLRDFTRDDDIGRKIIITFFMPHDSISNFIDKNITRQELVDQSTVFINNDRVSLKFQ